MLLIPAIDIKEGQCVRLFQGDFEQVSVCNADPVAVGVNWVRCGARRLHIVDLDGARSGSPKNFDCIKNLIEEVGVELPIQVGGGIRDLETIEKYLDIGVKYVILGTSVFKSPGFFREACDIFRGHILCGLDVRDGKIALEGWYKLSQVDIASWIPKLDEYALEGIIYTDVSRDGTLSGINLDATLEIANLTNIPVIASGGVAHLEDIQKLCQIEDHGVVAVICGKALYNGALDFVAAQKFADTYKGVNRAD
ncbi:MAG: 1-(5-phosphoribosyl)-5-[(5-phosphoribosylamino)methylideneamino]imidazole-4-carboxamide isomerase [Gammaproteobacteria bacterium]|nr:1-(5-phosphoribosyl)-5-[(5-phosphoribosylamino)methylideneamino]imidazole-4-carboxamide isomerase [Gammaproteobacteria bacterium]